jgi:hypothetical protein
VVNEIRMASGLTTMVRPEACCAARNLRSDTLIAKLCRREGTMNLIEDILNQLKSEGSRLDQAISALEGLASGSIARRGRSPKSGLTYGPRKRTMSAAARRRISAAMKARWAERKRGSKPAATRKPATKKAGSRRQMSPAARRKLSALMKARWAARKKRAKSK